MYVNVLLPLSLADNYTYSVPPELESEVCFGKRVIVQFGARRVYTALIYKVHDQKPDRVEPKDIQSIMDNEPIVTEQQMKIWEWIAHYYQCTLGEVFKAALPSGMKLESQTTIRLTENWEAEHTLKPKEEELLDLLGRDHKALNIEDLGKELSLKNALPVVKNLLDMGAVEVSEELQQKYKAKSESLIELDPQYRDQEKLHSVFDGLKNAPAQMKVLMTYLSESNFLNPTLVKEITKKELIEKSGCTANVIKSMLDKKIFVINQKEVSRNQYKEALRTQASHTLNQEQQAAYQEIAAQFAQKQTVLLHGVTSSGKTEIYIHLIQEVIKTGKQALFLLPEIALTTQITTRMRKVFGSQMCVYHSKFSDNERVEVWKDMLKGERCQVILGVRSSLFLPFRHLGLVIVDEEHETSYKQYDPAPRYNARDCAMVLAQIHQAKVLLGSATPSIETYFNAKSGKYGLVELNKRYEGLELPEIKIADIKEAYRKKEMVKNFTPELLQEMSKAFEKKEQVILFQNRRGFSPYIQCKSCGYIPKCDYCDVSLTYHKYANLLTCHYCGSTYPMPEICPACGNPTLETKGFGTEKIEEEVKELFPDVKVARMDMDVAKSRKKFEQIIGDFEEGKTDVLVGTQMISKGLDFERVHLVGVLNADSMLTFPDFRASERAYQLMAQVSGRAGRKGGQGVVVIQTSTPNDSIIQQVQANDYKGMFQQQLAEREKFHYPPFFRLTTLYLKGKDKDMVEHAAADLANELRAIFESRVYGPDKPVITRIQNMEIRKIVLKIERGANLEQMKKLTQKAINHTIVVGNYKSVFIYTDVDPA